jgi:uncharacterized membrane protein
MAFVKALQTGVRGNERINAFSDGVFAIAITLLVLELKVPEHAPAEGLAALVPELLPKFLGHVISFIVLGIYWVGQHNMFLHIKRHDRVLLWLNNLFLLSVASMPFFAGLVTHYADDRTALIAYAANLVVAGLVLGAIWRYATTGRRLVAADLADDMIAFVQRRVLLAPALYAVSIVVALFSPLAARLIFVLVALLYIVPNPLDHFHHRELSTGALVEMNDESEVGSAD